MEQEVVGRSRRWRPWVAVAAVLLVSVTSAWWLFWSARVVWPGDGSFGIGVPAQGEQTTWTFGGLFLCLEGVDAALVDAVVAESGDAEVTDFAVREPQPPDDDGISLSYGSEPERLADAGFGGDRTIRAGCAEGEQAELAVEVTRPQQGTVRAEGLLVHWSAGLRSGTTRVPATFALCDARDADGPVCEI